MAGQLAGRRRGRALPSSYSSSRSAAATSSSAMPVQPASDSSIGSPRYSSASRPTADALIRSGRSLETSVTSVALVGEVAGHREDPGVVVAEPEAGRAATSASVWLSSTRMVPPCVADRDRLVEPAVRDPQLVEHPQRRAGEVAELGVVPLALELGDHHDRQHDLVLVEAPAAPPGRPAGRWCRGRRCGRPRRGHGLGGRLGWSDALRSVARGTPCDRHAHSAPGPELSC